MSQATLLPSEHFSPSVSPAPAPATALPAVRKPGDMFSPARRLGLTAFQSMEDCAGALDYSLRALESAARTMLALGR